MKEKRFFKKLSLLPCGLRYKLLIAFSLMSIIPLLALAYLVNNFILPELSPSFGQISIVILLCVVIAWLGLLVTKDIIERVIDIALEAKAITEGNFEKKIYVDTDDEIGQIGEVINFLTTKIKDNITDLREYQGKMKEINVDIQRRVSVLSNVLDIGELISSSVKFENIIGLILSKLSQLYDNGFAMFYFSESPNTPLKLMASHNWEDKSLIDSDVEEGKGFLGRALAKRKFSVIDDSSKFSADKQEFRTKYKMENIIAFPLFSAKGCKGVLVVGNSLKNFTYTSDDIEVIKIFAEQISIAMEMNYLIKKSEKLEIKDRLTDLFNKTYIIKRLGEEIERSVVSQRPCSFILIDIDNFNNYKEKFGPTKAEIALTKIAHAVSNLIGPLGRAGRMEEGLFAVIMPETNKKSALAIAETIRSNTEKLELSPEEDDRITVCCGVSENPLDGAKVSEITGSAEEALKKAKEMGKNKIIGAGA